MSTNVIPSDSKSIFAQLSTLDSAAILRPNNPPSGIAGFLFDCDLDQSIELISQITDYAIEDNTMIQDNIALMPEIVVLKGLIAELSDSSTSSSSPSPTPTTLPLFPEIFPAYAPATGESAGASQAAEGAVGPAAKQATGGLYEYYLNRSPIQPGETNQGLAFGYFYQMWLGRQMSSIETPWGILTNMAILSVKATQPEESKDATDFTITFKKIRIAQQVSVNLGQLAGRNSVQATADAPAQNGTTGQTPALPAQAQSWAVQLGAKPQP